jgi:hypothetical protein
MSYYKDFNPIKNGDFSIEDEGGMYPFLHWYSNFYFDENDLVKYVATSTTDYELKDTVCCKLFIDEQLLETSPSSFELPGINQQMEIHRATDSSVLKVEFLAKYINGVISVSEYAAVALTKSGDSTYFKKEEVKITDSYDNSWVKCYCEFELEGNGAYILTIAGIKTGASSSQYYVPQEFLISNVKANITNHLSPYINVVDHGEFEMPGDLSYWNKHYTWEDSTYEMSISNGSLKLSGTKHDIGITQTLSIPDFIRLTQYSSADIVIDADVYGQSTVVALLSGGSGAYQYQELLSAGRSNSGKKAVSILVSESLNYPYFSLGNYSRILLEVYARQYYFDQSSGYKVSIKSIKVNLFNPNNVSSGGTGDFDNPYTDEDGRFLHSLDKSEFRFYNGSSLTKRSFILIDGEYYLADSAGICREGIYSINEKLYYVFPSGRVACNERFIYEDKVYQADSKCQYTYLCDKLTYINIKHKGNIINSKLMGITIGAVRLELEFPEQYEDVTLTATYKNGNRVIKSINIAPGTKNNVVNLITEHGQDMITFSYVNIDGSEVKASFYLDVVNYGNEYDKELSLDILSETHYVALDSSLGISYIIKPNLAVEVDVEWSSSDEDVAIVDVFGSIKPLSLGTCTITATNSEFNISDTCTLHVVERTDDPASIELTQYEANLGISDSVFVEAIVLNEDGTTVNTNQEVIWESEKTSIATVSNGYIVGMGEGTTNIYCYSYDDRNVRSVVTVTVSGEYTAIDDIELNMYETMLDYNNRRNAYEYLEWTVIPLNTNQTEVTLVSSDPSTVEVAVNGKLTIGSKPQLNVPITVRCTSVSNPEIYRDCIVTVVDRNYLPTITMKEKSVRTYIGKPIEIEYNISEGYEIQDAVIKATATGAYSDNIASIQGKTIRVNPMEAGKFTLTISHISKNGTVSKTCEIAIYKYDEEPQYIKYLDLLYAFQDGSYILRYFALDSDDDLNLVHYINVDNEDYYSSAHPELLLYKGDEYHYIFGSGLKVGYHTIKVKVVDTYGLENISDEVALIISDKNDRKEVLKESHDHYEEIKNDLIDCLNDIIEDGKMGIDDKREFITRYKMFNVAYENLLSMLDHCVKHINSQIETSQSEMATLADSLDTGVAVATYSEGDYTNSNFETVTDMDYYQNECIKKLAARIFELEARLEELANNNNN